jgi:hypothetical protein
MTAGQRGIWSWGLVWIMLSGCQPSSSTSFKPSNPESTSRVSEKMASEPSSGSLPPAGISGTQSAAEGSIAVNAPQPIRWRSAGKDHGVDAVYRNGENAFLYAMIEANGGGPGILDYDRDGDLDLFFPGGGELTKAPQVVPLEHQIYRNRGDGFFERLVDQAGSTASRCYSFGVNVGDYDQDGFADIMVTGWGGQQLFRNQGDGTFLDATESVGLTDRGWSSCSAWCDIEGDGLPDLYVSHYARWSPETEKVCYSRTGQRDRCVPSDYEGEPDQLLRQTGEGVFEDVSAKATAPASRGLGVAAGDWDIDGDIDLYVANDVHANLYFENRSEGLFTELGTRSGTAIGSRSVVDGSMGIGVGDYDGNGFPDFLVTNYQDEYCELYANQGKNYFKLATRNAGLMTLGTRNVAWGVAMLDIDHDGDEDALVVAGHTSRNPQGSTNKQRPYCLENQDQKRLVSLGTQAGDFFDESLPARGLATGDIDGDGDLDAVVSLLEEPARLLFNQTPTVGHWLQVELVGTKCNRDAIGAWVEVQAAGKRWVRHRFSGGSYASSHAAPLHFGLGNLEKIDRLVVHWPGQKEAVLVDIAVDQRAVLVQGAEQQTVWRSVP